VLIELLIGGVLIAITVAIHAFTIDRFWANRDAIRGAIRKYTKTQFKIDAMIATALALFLAHVIEIGLWAAAYLFLGQFDRIEEAFYFSISAYTTVGFGDVVLSTDWRLLSGIEAVDGMLLFGWSTAFLYAIMQRVWQSESESA
jgi:hypothetical protein